ncbi:HAMP domain-containing histidine kinase [Lederbergia sp. NSJ-179]|uniref:HAMP domain-containing sensor histidine kinase n=1 Tax=Lederbergia sp. NSJ-179 TaxID=2931402 RepID=UPI001FD329B8|nr:HAMP domain-containing sensor histidine kinase [Lederbergia sp. NSJ-179]MCJ7841634.1 HAMP domain-containing histidine kinase [Lederbergia sp. NSJ-179]
MLCIGLIVTAIISALWIRHSTLENRLNMMVLLSGDIAGRISMTDEQGKSKPFPGKNPPALPPSKQEGGKDLMLNPFTYIIDTEGTIISSNRLRGPFAQQIPPSVLQNENTIQEHFLNDMDVYVVKSPIEMEEEVIGWVVMVESKQNLSRVKQEYTQLAIMIISLALLGWAAIYILTTRLSKPIKDVATAAKHIAEGNYRIDLPNNSKEKEVYELIHSFEEMTKKLERLESLRTELLAGVTHELKTPVTSISGLLQAIKDGVVTGEEAKEFVNLSLHETEKMKKMVEDLLAFNQFAAKAVDVNKKRHDLNDVVEGAVYSWNVPQDERGTKVNLTLLGSPVEVNIDPIRFQQIMTNLLNNAKQAMDQAGEIDVTLHEEAAHILIDVKDVGKGIPAEEQPFIFERFYRGEGKKYKVRGLGLGLSLSKMIAQALGGDLVLLKSSPSGTVFRIYLPKNNS